MKKTKYPVMNMGTVSILTIFIILCMVTFAVLTYLSTQKDAAFAEQLAERTSAYYAAVSEANRKIADADAAFRDAWENGEWEALEPELKFSVPIEDGKELQVMLEPYRSAEENGKYYRILQFQEVATDDWQPDQSLPVLQP